MKLVDLTNKTFGKITVLKRAGNRIEPSGRTKVYWTCKCDCGTEKEIDAGALRAGRSKSCGCIVKENTKNLNLSHGMCKTLEYKTWKRMKDRCLNPNSKRYSQYGGRGIKVCDRWLDSFENFYEDMGDKPSKDHSIDRIDVNGDYEPENCRWTTNQEQQYNKTTTLYIEYNGDRKSLSEMCKIYNLNYKSTWRKYNKGISFEKILTKK